MGVVAASLGRTFMGEPAVRIGSQTRCGVEAQQAGSSLFE